MACLTFKMPGEKGRISLLVALPLVAIAIRHLKSLGARKIKVVE